MNAEPPASQAVTLCLTEMVARAAKHVLRSEMQKAEVCHLSKLAAHILSCIFDGAEGAGVPTTAAATKAAETNTTTSKGRGGKKKGKSGNSNSAANNANTAAAANAASAMPAFASTSTHQSVWADIVARIRLHFKAIVNEAELKAMVAENKLPLLRSVCQKTGVQLVAREYTFGGGGIAFAQEDILCIHPTVKHTPPTCAEGHALENAATNQFNAGNLRQAHELAERAIDVFHQVYGPMHASVAKCNRLVGLVMVQSDNFEAAITSQEKATLIAERVLGRDHTDTINNYVHLGQYYYVARQTARALSTIYHARNLCLVTYGVKHPEMPSIDIQMARALMDFKKFDVAMAYLDEALAVQREINGDGTLLEGHVRIIAATAQRDLGNHRAAVASVKVAHDIYVAKFGEDDPRSKESLASYKVYAAEAVRIEKLRKLHGAKGLPAAVAAAKKSGGSGKVGGAGGAGLTGSVMQNARAAAALQQKKKGGRRRNVGAKSKRGGELASPPLPNGRGGQASIDEVMSFINGV